MKMQPTTVLAAILSLVLLGVAGLIGVSVAGNGDSTPLAAFLTATVAPTIVALLALLRVEHAHTTTKETLTKVNGHLDQHVALVNDLALRDESTARYIKQWERDHHMTEGN